MVILCAVASYIFEIHDRGAPFTLTGHIDAGLPSVAPPPFSRTVGENRTASFVDMTRDLNTGILVVPLISIIGNVAIAKAFCKCVAFDYMMNTERKISTTEEKNGSVRRSDATFLYYVFLVCLKREACLWTPRGKCGLSDCATWWVRSSTRCRSPAPSREAR